MEATDRDRDTSLAKLSGHIERAGILIGLDPNHADQSASAALLDAPDDAADGDDGVGLVMRVDDDLSIRAQDLSLRGVEDQTVDAGKRIRRGQPAAPPLDDVAVIVVMRGLDQLDEELGGGGLPGDGVRLSPHARFFSRTRPRHRTRDPGSLLHLSIVSVSPPKRRGLDLRQKAGPIGAPAGLP